MVGHLKNTNDTRESAAIYVADLLLDEMANIHVYDPKVNEKSIYDDLNYLGSRDNDENKKLLQLMMIHMKIVKMRQQY